MTDRAEYRRSLSPFEKMMLNIEWRRMYPRAYRQTSSVPGIGAILRTLVHSWRWGTYCCTTAVVV